MPALERASDLHEVGAFPLQLIALSSQLREQAVVVAAQRRNLAAAVEKPRHGCLLAGQAGLELLQLIGRPLLLHSADLPLSAPHPHNEHCSFRGNAMLAVQLIKNSLCYQLWLHRCIPFFPSLLQRSLTSVPTNSNLCRQAAEVQMKCESSLHGGSA